MLAVVTAGATGPPDAGDIAAAKRALRAQIRAARAARTGADLAAVEASIGARADDLVALVPRAGAGNRCIAAYLSVGGEPGTRLLLDALAARDVTVLLPVLLPDLDLDWARYTGRAELGHATSGPRPAHEEPTGPRLGTAAIARADLILVPALAVDTRGHRLGQGGGSYDRALARVGPATPVLAVVHTDEIRADVPTEAHDRIVSGACTPAGVIRFYDEVGSKPGGCG